MTDALTEFSHPLARLVLHRYPKRRGERLRAWDGADLYLLDLWLEQALGGDPHAPASGAPLVLNDSCGALALALHAAAPVSSGDDALARAAWWANAADNGLPVQEEAWRWPQAPWPQAPSRVLVRVPKEMALLEQQLGRLGALPPGTPVHLAWMDKHMPGNLLARVRHYLGEVELLRGRYKAHGLTGRVPGSVPDAPYPTSVKVPEQGWELVVHAGVFAQQQLDIGARLFMDTVPQGAPGPIADLGCGNGVIGMVAAQRNPGVPVTFCDVSWLALQSARENMARWLPQAPAQFHLGNGLEGLDTRFALILLNPPFHRGHAVDDSVARMLFAQAAKRLLPGGVLQVTGNRHLRYDVLLKRHFTTVTQVGGDRKFVVLAANDPR